MAEKEIKTFLKDAREYIKVKEYKNALREIKKVLNKDKNNYMGLVFCGLCLSELDQPDQALQAYKRAITSTPEQATAWEGLAKFYEKNAGNTEYRQDRIQTLHKLLTFAQDDVSKHYDICSKVAQLQVDGLDLDGAVKTLQVQAKHAEQDTEKYRSSLEMIVKLLSSQPELNKSLSQVYEETLDSLISDKETIQNLENLKLLIKQLYKVRGLEKLVMTALKMVGIYPENSYPLEWICKVYLEWAADTLDFDCEELNDPSVYYKKLLELNPTSTLGNLARGAHLVKMGNMPEGIPILSAGTDVSAPNVYGLYMLTKAEVEAKNYSAVELSVASTVKHLDKVKEQKTREKMSRDLNLMLIKSLYYQGSKEKLENSLETVKGLESSGMIDPELGFIIAKIYATLGLENEVSRVQSSLEISVLDSKLIQALVLYSRSELESGEKLLSEILLSSPDSSEILILLGRICWELKKSSQSLGYFLKAAKVEPGSWVPFLYLGHYYRSLGSDQGLEKARKCYQKCVELNPQEVSAGQALSDIYRQTGNLEDNLNFLTGITGRSTAASGKCTWAWLRLGVHYLAADEPSLAVQALQSALRGDSGDLNCWEALADAYLARGSFTAAHKAYEKVLQMNPGSEYTRLMIAVIKERIGKWREAVVDFRFILKQSPEYLPALRGLGESLVAQAQNFIDENLDRNAVDCVEEGLEVLTQAAELKPGLPGTWRLLGDCCALLGELPTSVVILHVPSKLVGGTEGKEKIDKLKLLELGSRCYIRALNLNGENWRVWHQLGLVYSALGKLNSCRDLALKSLSVMKHAVKLAPAVNSVWNSLGVIACQVEDWALAQHSFIKSLEVEISSGAWTNLGVLYLHLGNAHLANRAFKEAQNHEPSNLRGWAGQALVAEVAGFRSESMDLFRHCTFLGGEPESALGYGNWICSTLSDLEKGEKVESHNRYILEQMHGLAVAADSLRLYCQRKPDNSLALCQLAIVLERQGLLRRACEILERARGMLEASEKWELLDKVLGNLGRIQSKLGEHEKAVDTFKSIRTTSLYSQVGLALAYFSCNRFQESYSIYDSCFHWLANKDGLKSDILVAMGILAYKVEGVQSAKTLLFQSCQLHPPSVRGILALCVIGIQSSDLNLIDAALSEMKVHENDQRHAHDIAFLRASVMLLKGDGVGARKSLLRAAHAQPWLPGLWRVLSVFLLQNSAAEAGIAATLCKRSAATSLDQTDKRYISVLNEGKSSGFCGSLSTAESLVLESLCLLTVGDRAGAQRSGSKLCHLYPHLPSSWAVLAAAGDKSCSWLRNVLELVRQAGDSQLTEWVGHLV